MQECANISARQQGQKSEIQALEYYQRRGFQISGQNQKLFGVEVDLIVYCEHWVLVEVKSITDFDNLSYRLNHKQKKRLLRVRHLFEDQTQQSVELRVLYVSGEKFLELAIEDHGRE